MPFLVKKPTLITLRIEILPEAQSTFIEWQAKFNSKMVAFPGFVSLEFLAPSEQQKEWLVVQRLSNAKHASEWQDSPIRKELMNELKSCIAGNGIQEVITDESSIRSGVTEIIVTEVKPGKEKAYRDWSAKIHKIEASFAGFRGVYVQSPREGVKGHWMTLLQFDSIENLDRWLESSEREELLKESIPLISSLETNRMISPYAGWFASIAKVGELPPVWKQTMIVLLVLFPIVMMELKYLNPLMMGYNTALSTFIGNAISVALISFPMMPIAIWLLGWWLSPRSRSARGCTVIGTLLVILLYLLEVIIFWRFL